MPKSQGLDFATILSDGWQKMALTGAGLSPRNLQDLAVYFTELAKWRRKINLVANADDCEIIENHFLDSLTLLPILTQYRHEKSPALLDIGSGAGFPGLVIKIVCPWLRVILVEPRQKRLSFLRHIVRNLQLKDIELRQERLAVGEDDFLKNYGRPEIITSRAVADIKTFLDMLNYAPLQSRIICMKGPGADAEIAAWQKSGGSVFNLADRQDFTLPVSGAERVLLVFTKE